MILCVFLIIILFARFPPRRSGFCEVGSGLIRRMEGQTRYGRKGLKAKDRWKWKVRFERGTDITNSILCESPGSRSAPLLYIIANDDKYNYISLYP